MTETKNVYNKEDLEEWDIVVLSKSHVNEPRIYRVRFDSYLGVYLDFSDYPHLEQRDFSSLDITAVYKPHWEKPKEVKKHSMEELYKIVGYKFEIKE